LRKMLSPGENKGLADISSEERRASFCICRGTLRMLLGRYAGSAPGQVRLRSGPFGKPSLDPSGPGKDIEFNVSHSGRVALISLAAGRRIGVDVEEFRGDVRVEDLARNFFTAQEREPILALSGERKAKAFYACWTRKEAAIKAVGGSAAALCGKVIVSSHPGRPARILQMPSRPDRGEWHLEDLPVGEGYAAALCCDGRPSGLFLWEQE